MSRSKKERIRALENAGKQTRRPRVEGSRGAGGVVSHSDEVAANSENSALAAGSTSAASGAGAPTPHPLQAGGQGVANPLAAYDWFREYEELTELFSWRVAAYIAWAAAPVAGRKPGTVAELARALGLKTDRTIRQWKEKQPEIEKEIVRRQALPLVRHRRDIFEALVKSALIEGSGGHADRKLALELTGDYTPRLRQTVENAGPAAPYTSDELARAERELEVWELGRQGDKEMGRQGDREMGRQGDREMGR